MWPVTNRWYCILLELNLKHIHIFKAWIIKKNLNTFEHGTKLVWTVALQPFGHEATIFLSEIIPKSTSLLWSTETCHMKSRLWFKFPSPWDSKDVKCPGAMLKLWFDQYIIDNYWIKLTVNGELFGRGHICQPSQVQRKSSGLLC